jgi:hypothetical protein
MIRIVNKNGLEWYEFNTLYYCFISFSLAELLSSLPNELKQICLTQLN